MTLRIQRGQLYDVAGPGGPSLVGEIQEFKLEIDRSGSVLASAPFPCKVAELAVDIDCSSFRVLMRDPPWETLRRQAMAKGRRGWKHQHVRDRAKRGRR